MELVARELESRGLGGGKGECCCRPSFREMRGVTGEERQQQTDKAPTMA